MHWNELFSESAARKEVNLSRTARTDTKVAKPRVKPKAREKPCAKDIGKSDTFKDEEIKKKLN